MTSPYHIQIDPNVFKTLASKNAIVTGGCSGIGLEVVKILDSLNCNIVVGDLQNPPHGESELFSKKNILFTKFDTSKWDSQKHLFESASTRFSNGLDFVIANAGILEYGDQFFGSNYDEHGVILEPDHRVIDVNLKGVLNTVALALHYFGDRGGNIVLTASLAGYQGIPGLPVYSASKHGVWGLMQSLRYSVPARKTAISVVAPGMVTTPLLQHLPDQEGKPLDNIIQNLHRTGLKSSSPRTVATAIVYLASQGKERNGAALSVEDNEIVDLEKLLKDNRPEYVRQSLGFMFWETPRAWE